MMGWLCVRITTALAHRRCLGPPSLKTLIPKFRLEFGKCPKRFIWTYRRAGNPNSGKICSGLESEFPGFSLSLWRSTQYAGPRKSPCLWWGLNLFLPWTYCVKIKSRRDSKILQKLYGPRRNHFKRIQEIRWGKEMQAKLECLQYPIEAVELDLAGGGMGVMKRVF